MKKRLYREKIFWLRKNKKGWSQEEAAFACGAFDKKQYHLWESGKTVCPRKDALEKIVKAFGLQNIDEIIIRPGESPAPFYSAYYYDEFKKAGPDTSKKPSTGKYKLVCFDVDGTLIKGLDFSWKVVWGNLVNDGERRRKEGLKLYHTKKITYEEWCSWCCDCFKKNGIKREDLSCLAKKYNLAVNTHESLNLLKKNGLVMAIISGGINTFLEDLFPNYSEYFEYVFINKIIFNKKGEITSVIPTPFDFEGKSSGVLFLCEKLGISPSDSVFVGEAFNDKSVINTVGLSIAFQPSSLEIEELFDETIFENDLMLVSKRILRKKSEPL